MTLPEAEPLDLTTTNELRASVAHARWTLAEVGWGQVTRNRWGGEPSYHQGLLLKLGGKAFAKGLSAHAKSRYEFALGGRWQSFTTTVGVRDGAPEFGSAVFIIEGDGVELARSQFLRSGQSELIKADMRNVQKLTLRTEGTEGHNHGCWTIWCDPVVERK
jgi:hypothetical protein